MDLTQSFPRSPKVQLAGLVHLPRMLDKAGAFNAGTLGEYYFPCPLDDIILEFLQTDSESLEPRHSCHDSFGRRRMDGSIRHHHRHLRGGTKESN